MSERKTNENELVIELNDGGALLIPEVTPKPTLPSKEDATGAISNELGPDFLKREGDAPGQKQPE